MERCWRSLKPEILARWDKLSEYDLTGIGGDFDGLVEIIRQRYFPGRSKLSIEAEIRDWLVLQMDELEKSELCE